MAESKDVPRQRMETAQPTIVEMWFSRPRGTSSITQILIDTYGRCPVKGCAEPALEQHHILYDDHQGGPFTKNLCSEHHGWITRRQSHQGRKQRFKLTEKQRWFFWNELIEGRMRRPRSTALDREWKDQFTTQEKTQASMRPWRAFPSPAEYFEALNRQRKE